MDQHNLNNKSKDLPTVYAISIDNNIVSHVASNECLGVLIDEKLTFETHIEYICKKACTGIGVLRRIKPFVSLCTLVTLYNSLVQPYFDYCSHYGTLVERNWKINCKNFKAVWVGPLPVLHYIRYVDILDNLKRKNLETRRSHIKATLMYKIPNDQSAPHLRASLTKLNDTNINYDLRNFETDLKALPRPKTNFLKRSFKYSGAMLWNNLSCEAKTAQSLSKFKSKLVSLPSAGSLWFINLYVCMF